MIVFRDQRVSADPRAILSTLRLDLLQAAGVTAPSHDDAIRLLTGMGTLEAALCDALFPDADGVSPLSRRLREVSSALGRILWHTWHDQPSKTKRWMDQAAATLAYLELQSLPTQVQLSVPEGYAYYAVYPEMYLEAARRFHNVFGSVNAVCIGLRSIGTSLSAAVAGALLELGCCVTSYTLRPRGHPFERRPLVDAPLESALRAEQNAFFLIIDEGPGISGSSLGGTAAFLSDLGIDDQRIVLFPSWETDGSGLRSPGARSRWGLHRRFVTSFEEVWLDSGRLQLALPPGQLRDVSAGAWRAESYPDDGSYPPIHPQHERRKYLLEPPVKDNSGGQGRKLLSFVGFDDRAVTRLERAAQAAESGFTIGTEMVVHGFLVRSFRPGRPVSADEPADLELLETIASYLAHISCERRAEASVTEESLRTLVTTNVEEALGEEWLPRLRAMLSGACTGWCERSVALDGRMLPHEWIRSGQRYLKTDAVDHHDDHFFPGCQDIAWDVAGTCLEFGLPLEARSWLIRRYQALSNDRTIAARLPVHAVTYLAFRLGYASLAAKTLGGTADGKRFATAAKRYGQLLRHELDPLFAGTWNA